MRRHGLETARYSRWERMAIRTTLGRMLGSRIPFGEVVPSLIAALALVVAAATYVRQGRSDNRQQGLQERMASLEEERRQDERASRDAAHVFIRLVKHRTRAGSQFVIMNDGPSEARNIDFTAVSASVPDWAGPVVAREGFPIPVLQAGGRLEFRAHPARSEAPPYDITLRWVDGRGPREATTRVATELVD